jgi:hypothetical protein
MKRKESTVDCQVQTVSRRQVGHIILLQEHALLIIKPGNLGIILVAELLAGSLEEFRESDFFVVAEFDFFSSVFDLVSVEADGDLGG